jgi:hypothetical protein
MLSAVATYMAWPQTTEVTKIMLGCQTSLQKSQFLYRFRVVSKKSVQKVLSGRIFHVFLMNPGFVYSFGDILFTI